MQNLKCDHCAHAACTYKALYFNSEAVTMFSILGWDVGYIILRKKDRKVMVTLI
jgi:hypothetical protein